MAGKREAHFEPERDYRERRRDSYDRDYRREREYTRSREDYRRGDDRRERESRDRSYYAEQRRDGRTRRRTETPPHARPQDDYRQGRAGGGRRGRNGKRRMPRWQKAIIITLAILVGLLAAAAIAVEVYLGRIERLNGNTTYTDETFDTDAAADNTLNDTDVNWGQDQKVLQDQDVINVLLIGCDSRSQNDRGRSDSMILLSLNRKTQQISMVSLMRDSYVQIPGYSNNKINAAYSFGGHELLDQTIEQNYGVHIDYNVVVDFSGFSEIVDDLDGIDIELTSGEAQYLNDDIDTDVSNLSEGVNHLDGKTALAYARARHVSTGTEADDFGRTYRQRVVLMTIYHTLMSKSWTDILTIMNDSIFPCIATDMNSAQILSLGLEFYNMGIENIQSYRLPADNEFADETINKMRVLVPDWDAARAHLQEWLYSDTPVTADSAA